MTFQCVLTKLRGVGGCFVGWVAITLALCMAPATSSAQAQGASGRVSVLVSVILSKDAQAAPAVLLTFDGPVPRYSIIANDNNGPIIAFANTVRGPAASLPPGAADLLRRAVFEQHDGVLTLTLTADAPVHMVASASGGQAISLSFVGAQQRGSPGAAASAGALPAFVERDPSADGFEVVPLKYADVSEVVGLLTADQSVRPNDTFTPQEPAFGSAGMMNSSGAPTPGATMGPGFNPNNNDAANQSLGHTIDDAIGVDRRLNAIVLRGSADRIARLKAKIDKIDVPVASVVLETVFVELTQTGAKNVGLDFNNANSQIATAAYTTGDYLSSGGGSHGIGSVSLQAAIYAQVQEGRGRIISRPRISAQSGSTAKIVTGDALPILTAITLSGVNGVSQQVQYVTVGVTLQIAPRVSDDGFVTSHVFSEVSSVTGYSQGYPTISQREASTSATVRDGESFVIGGLTEENDLSTNGKVPVAGDVPLVGRLFQLQRRTSSKTELYIVVTPHIVGGAADLTEARRDRDLAFRSGSAAPPAR